MECLEGVRVEADGGEEGVLHQAVDGTPLPARALAQRPPPRLLVLVAAVTLLLGGHADTVFAVTPEKTRRKRGRKCGLVYVRE